MSALLDLLRRLRRSRVALWTVILLAFFFTLSELHQHIQRRGHEPIVFTELDDESVSECSLVPPEELERLQEGGEMTLHAYHSGRVLEPDEKIHAYTKLCIIVAVPQTMPESGIFKDMPVPGKGPDNVHLYFDGSSVLVTVPPLLPLPSQPGTDKQLAIEAILYYHETVLRDEGTYEINAEREFANWRWAKQWWHSIPDNTVHFTTGHLEPVSNDTIDDIAKIMEVNRIVNDGKPLDFEAVEWANLHPPTITVMHEPHPDLPTPGRKRCSALPYFDMEGARWYNSAAFPNLDTELADEWGYIYTPESCTLDYFSDVESVECLANRNIHMFGDSNSRRLTRALISGGHWCVDPLARCQSEDWGDAVDKVVWNDATSTLDQVTETLEHNGQFELGERSALLWGRNASISFTFLQSIAVVPKDWLSNFYEPGDFTIEEIEGPLTPFDPYQLRAGAKARRPPDLEPRPDLVVVGIGAWDEAFDPTFADFERTVPYFRDAILESYPDPLETKLMLRVSQGFCCRSNWTEDLRRFSGSRIQHFHDMVASAWELDGGRAMGGRVEVLDASGMAGRPEVARQYGQVGSNHQRASHARLEAQILLNRVCTRDHEGRAVWKGDMDLEGAEGGGV